MNLRVLKSGIAYRSFEIESRLSLISKTLEDLTRKIFDFISGATYALEGNSQQLGKHVYVCSQQCRNFKDACTLMIEKITQTLWWGEHSARFNLGHNWLRQNSAYALMQGIKRARGSFAAIYCNDIDPQRLIYLIRNLGH